MTIGFGYTSSQLDGSLFALDGNHHESFQGNEDEDGIKHILRILNEAQDTIQHVSPCILQIVPEPTPLGPEGVTSRVVKDIPLTDARWIINDDTYMSNLLESLLPQSDIFNRKRQIDHEGNHATVTTTSDYSPLLHHQRELEGNSFKKRRHLSINQQCEPHVDGKLHRSVLAPSKNFTSTSSKISSCYSCSASAEGEGCTTQHGLPESSNKRFRTYQSEQWNHRFEDLKVFQAKNGHCLVPHNFPENQALSQWIKRQRYQYKLKIERRHSTLTDDRQNKLEAMGFIWDSHKAGWEEKFRELCLFRQKYGHSNVPSKYTNKALAIWVKCQRRQYKLHQQGAQSAINEERILKLESLDFVFNPRNL